MLLLYKIYFFPPRIVMVIVMSMKKGKITWPNEVVESVRQRNVKYCTTLKEAKDCLLSHWKLKEMEGQAAVRMAKGYLKRIKEMK